LVGKRPGKGKKTVRRVGFGWFKSGTDSWEGKIPPLGENELIPVKKTGFRTTWVTTRRMEKKTGDAKRGGQGAGVRKRGKAASYEVPE